MLVQAIGRRDVFRPTKLLISLTGAMAIGAMAVFSWTPRSATAWAGGLATLLFNSVFITTLVTIPVATVIGHRRRTAGDDPSWTRHLPLAWVLLLALAVWAALPRERFAFDLAPVNVFDVFRVASATVDAAKVTLFATLLAVLWAMSRSLPPSGSLQGSAARRRATRSLAWASGAAMLLRPDALFGGLPIAFLAGLGLLRWALVLPPPIQDGDSGAVRKVVAAGNRYRLIRELQRTLEQKVASGDMALDQAEDKIGTALRHARHPVRAGAVDLDSVQRARGFGSGHPDPWRRGLTGAAVAVIAGLPVFLEALTLLSHVENRPGAVPVLSASSALILILRYPLYGFYFGYFFPWLRGDTGLRKAWSFLAVLGGSEALVLLLPYQGGEDVFGAFLSWGAQIVLISFALGLVFDALTLRRANLGLSALLDLHHSSRLVAFSSAVAASIAAALATALASSAVALLTSQLGSG
jgi:hypothetical protein